MHNKKVSFIITAFAILFLSIIIVFAQSVPLSWDASPTSGVNYNLYRTKTSAGCGAGGAVGITSPACIKVNTTPITVLTFSDTPGISGRWFYVVRAVDSDSLESNNSNELMVEIRPLPPPNLRKN